MARRGRGARGPLARGGRRRCVFPARRRSASMGATSTRTGAGGQPVAQLPYLPARRTDASRPCRAAHNWRTHWHDDRSHSEARHPTSCSRRRSRRSIRSPSYFGRRECSSLIQSCNHCPYVQAWEGRMNAAARDYADRGVLFVAINSNDEESHPVSSFDEMVKRAPRARLRVRLPARRRTGIAACARLRPALRKCSSSTAIAASSTTARSTMIARATHIHEHVPA